MVIVVTPYLVNPVDDRELHLPTAGYQTPNQLETWILNRENSGVSGGTRPMPQAVAPAGAAPTVGAAGTTPVLDADRPRAAAAPVPTPGFSDR